MLSIYKAKEREIRAVLENMSKAAGIESMLEVVGPDMSSVYKLYSDKKIDDAVA